MFKLFECIPKRRLVFDFSFACIWGILNCYYVNVLSKLTDTMSNGEHKIIAVVLFYVAYILAWEFIEYISDVHQELTRADIENEISKVYFSKIYEIKPSVLKSNNTGYISGLVNKMIERKYNAYGYVMLYCPFSVIYVVWFIIQLGQYHYLFGVSLFVCILCGSIWRIVGGKIEKNKLDEMTVLDSERIKLFIDTVSNMGTAQKMQAGIFINDKMKDVTERSFNKRFSWIKLHELFFCGFKMIIYSFLPLCLYIYYKLPVGSVDNSSSLFSLLSVVCLQIVHVSKNIAVTFASYVRYKSVQDKIDDIVNNENIREDLWAGEFESAEVKDLDYSYTQNDESIRIRVPHFKVEKGDIICVHGESGQGKTTLLHTLSGEIETDNVYINQRQTKQRLNCVFISQDTEIFDMTLRENLTLGKDISDATLLEYLNAVGLKEWFDKQKDGLQTILGERGVFVSTGQRQRLNLVRGLLIDDREIYLLDEPTSNVDEETETRMIELIKRVLKNKTVVIVTHRPKIKAICNKSYVFKDGILSQE